MSDRKAEIDALIAELFAIEQRQADARERVNVVRHALARIVAERKS